MATTGVNGTVKYRVLTQRSIRIIDSDSNSVRDITLAIKKAGINPLMVQAITPVDETAITPVD